MTKTILALTIIMFSFNAHSENGTEACSIKKSFLSGICKAHTEKAGSIEYTNCSNGFSYSISTDMKKTDELITGEQIRCKITELRNESSISKRTTYYDEHNDKVVVYEHSNGLSNTFVYGHTGYYHISELSSGDSLYHFYSF